MSYLPKSEQARVRRKIEAAYNKPTYEEAKATLKALKPGLKLMNQSALKSLEEGLEETLTLHRLGLMPMLKDSFRTTNCIENVNSLLGQLTRNVRHWTNSSQRHRWAATALLDIEDRLRREHYRSNIPGLYIVGDLTGIPLLKFSPPTAGRWRSSISPGKASPQEGQRSPRAKSSTWPSSEPASPGWRRRWQRERPV